MHKTAHPCKKRPFFNYLWRVNQLIKRYTVFVRKHKEVKTMLKKLVNYLYDIMFFYTDYFKYGYRP